MMFLVQLAGASESFSRFYRMTSTNTAEYKLALGENHNFDALVGQEAIISNTRGFGASSTTTTDARIGNGSYRSYLQSANFQLFSV